MMTVGKAYKDNQYKVGKLAKQPSINAKLVVNVVRKMLKPISSKVS